MSRFYLHLEKATNIKRDESGYPYAWTGGGVMADFTTQQAFEDYVADNIESLKDVVAFSGSASLLRNANQYITTKLQEAGLL